MIMDVVDETRKIITHPYLLRLPGWTWERYLGEAPEMRFCEFENGDLVMHSPVDADHQRSVRFLSYLLNTYCLRKHAGEVLNGPAVLKIAPQIGREPDIFVLSPKESTMAKGMPLVVVPVFIVEITSRSTLRLDLETKPMEYGELGIPEYWVVDRSGRTLHQHFMEKKSYQVTKWKSGKLASRALKGFFIEVDWLWQDPLPSEIECIKKMRLYPA